MENSISDEELSKMSGLELMRYWGDLFHGIDREKFKKVLQDNVERYSALPQSTYFSLENRWDISHFDELEANSTFDLFQKYIGEPPQTNFDRLLVVKYALLTQPNILQIEEDILIGHWSEDEDKEPAKGYYFFHGDLYIKGNLDLGAHLYITGNLTVDGVINDTMEFTPLLVGGDIKAKGIEMGSQIFCAGEIVTPLLTIDGTGELIAGKQLSANLLIEDGYEHKIKAKLNVKKYIDFIDEEKLPLVQLEKLILPEIIDKLKERSKETAKELSDEKEGIFYFDKKIFFDYIREGKSIWKK